MIAFYAADEELEALPHAEEVFSALQQQGIKIALNTGFTRAVADSLLHRLHWDNGYHRIDRVICSDEVPLGRPYPDMIRALMTALRPSFAGAEDRGYEGMSKKAEMRVAALLSARQSFLPVPSWSLITPIILSMTWGN